MSAPPAPRRPGRGAPPITPERVVAVALAVADRDGVRGVTLGRVARELGCHVTSLYTHVASIDDLKRRLALAVLDEIAHELEPAVAGRDGADAVAAIAAVHRAYARRHPGRVQAMHAAPDSGDPELTEAGRRAAAPVRAALASFGLTGSQVRDAHRIFSAMTRGFVQAEAAGAFAAGDADATFDEMVALVVLGLRSGRWPTGRASTDDHPGGP